MGQDMNPLIRGLFNDFRKAEEITTLGDSDAFEIFASSLVLPNGLLAQVQKTDLLLDGGTPGIDVIAFEVNGNLIWDIDDVRDACENSSKVDVALYFVQAKRSGSVSGVEILNFGQVIGSFLNNRPFSSYPKIEALAKSLGYLFDNYASRLKAPPAVHIYFVTTAPRNSVTTESTVERVNSVVSDINGLGFLGLVTAEVLGADEVHSAWKRKNNANEVEIRLEKQLHIPEMPGVDQAILGVISVEEVFKLIKSGEGDVLDESVFYDNVRGFKGLDNPVNKQIVDTLGSSERALLPVLNNGITIVASSYSPKPGDAVSISDYQIVNGCQTSHCIHLAKEALGGAFSSVFVPVRLVVTGDEEIATKIIRATNSQTEVQENDLVALTNFQKKLEDFYNLDGNDVKLVYERRSGQFYGKEVVKARVVNISDQMKAISAVFLDAPQSATRYVSRLYDEVGSSIFREDHKLSPYVASAFAAYRIENAFRTGLDPSFKPIRYHILMAYKYHVLGKESAPLESRACEEQSVEIISALKRPGQVDVFRALAELIATFAGGQLPSSDRLKRQQFTQELLRFFQSGGLDSLKI
ncbi:AIPR family protein [Nocardiopsis sp. CNT312]|uniref:AIPR family protein n=1 Tax=Nocardiopsis sp. CNT312 TaxID=1137268 RepID=UPI0018CBFAA2|nr:AIPR family protein [Nocardiopsis sp. CNT312]